MTESTPIQQNERTVIVDIVRGFALVGVLFANINSYNYQNVPSDVFNSISTPVDIALNNFNAVFIEWKFFTIFSILFGYGFGLILSGLERKNINPVPFFLRRMFWLLIFGIIHTSFWWGDVLNFYCISGALLLFFRKFSSKGILISSLLLMFIVTPFISFLLRNQPDYFTDHHLQALYERYLYGDILDVIKTNIVFTYNAFFRNGADLHDIVETLGRFLFGYYLLRVGLFNSVESKKPLFKKVLLVTAPVMIAYFIMRWLLLKEIFKAESIYWEPFMKLGIIATSCFYCSVLVLIFISFGRTKLFSSLEVLGKMTLTNYLLISAFCVVLLYGIGFGKLGLLPMHTLWLFAFAWLVVEIVFSTRWLNKFRYGPAEWIWRQLTYRKRIQLRK